jgi:S-formylglutathione hydrolase FrmB
MRETRSALAGVLSLVVLAMIGGGCALDSAAKGGSTGDEAISSRPAAASSPARTLSVACRSTSLRGELPTAVYLPPGYRATGRRYPVVYFLHGLPAGPQSYMQNAFVAAALVTARERAIVVAPQGARGSDSDREYLDWSATEDWPRAIGDDLTACIDHRFHTVAGRSGRALVGLSAGGYGAVNIGLRNLRTFGAVESWSGYFVATDPSGYDVLKLGSAAPRRAASVPRGQALAAALRRWPALVAFYVGRSDG